MKKRGRRVSHKARVELILQAQKLRNEHRKMEELSLRADEMIKKDYWDLDDCRHLEKFKAVLND